MPHKHNLSTALTFLFRALLLRCPACGTKPLYVRWFRVRRLSDWFSPLDGCSRCGYPYEREPGYFLMAIWAVNYTFSAIVGLVLYGSMEYFFDLPIWTLMVAVLAPVLIFSVGFARHSKAIWLATDLFFDPHHRRDGDDDGDGDQHLSSPNSDLPPAARQPEPADHHSGVGV